MALGCQRYPSSLHPRSDSYRCTEPSATSYLVSACMAFVLGGSVVLRQDQPDGLSIGRSVRCGPALPSSRRTIHTRRRVGLLVPVRPRRAFPIVAENRPPSLGHLLKVSRWGLWSFFPSSLPSLRRHFVQDRARGGGRKTEGGGGLLPVRFGASRLSPRSI